MAGRRWGDDWPIKTDITFNTDTAYAGIRFKKGGVPYYGWLHIESSSFNHVTVDKWAYKDEASGTIMTLSDSVTTRKTGLTDGRVKLHWTNANEDGVARYEVQAKNAAGTRQALDSDTPGEGRYTAKANGAAECRLVIEQIDGTREEVEF